jgi:hypothetical protein
MPLVSGGMRSGRCVVFIEISLPCGPRRTARKTVRSRRPNSVLSSSFGGLSTVGNCGSLSSSRRQQGRSRLSRRRSDRTLALSLWLVLRLHLALLALHFELETALPISAVFSRGIHLTECATSLLAAIALAAPTLHSSRKNLGFTTGKDILPATAIRYLLRLAGWLF